MFGKLKEILHRVHLRQQEGRFAMQRVEERHVCSHCGTEFVGRFCPQCGQNVRNERFTASAVLHKMADSLGFDESGNRSILRTVRDLLWRPGYMIRDYLGGHSAAYFQPFKFLLLLVIAYTLLVRVTGIEVEEPSDLSKSLSSDVQEVFKPIILFAKQIVAWFRSNMTYAIIVQNIFVVTAMWFTYRRRSCYTWTETFVAQMYICCQFMLLAFVQTLITWQVGSRGLFPYAVNGWVVILVLLYDFYQLYGERSLWGTMWRLAKVYFWLALQYFLLLLLLVFVLVIYVAIIDPDSVLKE